MKRGSSSPGYNTESPDLGEIIDSDLWNAGQATPVTPLLNKMWPYSNMSIMENRRELKTSLFSNNIIVLVENSRAFTYD